MRQSSCAKTPNQWALRVLVGIAVFRCFRRSWCPEENLQGREFDRAVRVGISVPVSEDVHILEAELEGVLADASVKRRPPNRCRLVDRGLSRPDSAAAQLPVKLENVSAGNPPNSGLVTPVFMP